MWNDKIKGSRLFVFCLIQQIGLSKTINDWGGKSFFCVFSIPGDEKLKKFWLYILIISQYLVHALSELNLSPLLSHLPGRIDQHVCVSVSLLSEHSVGSSFKRYANILPDSRTNHLSVASVKESHDKPSLVESAAFLVFGCVECLLYFQRQLRRGQ